MHGTSEGMAPSPSNANKIGNWDRRGKRARSGSDRRSGGSWRTAGLPYVKARPRYYRGAAMNRKMSYKRHN